MVTGNVRLLDTVEKRALLSRVPTEVWAKAPVAAVMTAVGSGVIQVELTRRVLANDTPYTSWAAITLLRHGFFSPYGDVCTQTKPGTAVFDQPLWNALGNHKATGEMRQQLLDHAVSASTVLKAWDDIVHRIRVSAGPPDKAPPQLWATIQPMFHQAKVKYRSLSRQTATAALKMTPVSKVFRGFGNATVPPASVQAASLYVAADIKLAPVYKELQHLTTEQWLSLISLLWSATPLDTAAKLVTVF